LICSGLKRWLIKDGRTRQRSAGGGSDTPLWGGAKKSGPKATWQIARPSRGNERRRRREKNVELLETNYRGIKKKSDSAPTRKTLSLENEGRMVKGNEQMELEEDEIRG